LIYLEIQGVLGGVMMATLKHTQESENKKKKKKSDSSDDDSDKTDNWFDQHLCFKFIYIFNYFGFSNHNILKKTNFYSSQKLQIMIVSSTFFKKDFDVSKA